MYSLFPTQLYDRERADTLFDWTVAANIAFYVKPQCLACQYGAKVSSIEEDCQ
jgi:hypothetical protein